MSVKRTVDADEWRIAGENRRENRTEEGLFTDPEREFDEFSDPYVVDYLNSRKQANKGEGTISGDKTVFRKYIPFLNKEVVEATYIDVSDFMESVAAKGHPTGSLRQHLTRISGLHKYLNARHQAGLPEVNGIDCKKLAQKSDNVREGLSKKEVHQLIVAAGRTKFGVRNQSIIAHLYLGGLRANEVVDLMLDDVDVNKRILTVRNGKGNKTGYVPLLPQLKQNHMMWVESERSSYIGASESNYVFFSKSGKKLSKYDIHRIVTDAAEIAGIQEVIDRTANGNNIYRVKPHVLRHTIAEHMRKDGVPEDLIRQFLRHDDIKTTRNYTKAGLGTYAVSELYDSFTGL